MERDIAKLDASFSALVAALALPPAKRDSDVRRIASCAKPLTFRKAKLLKADGAQSLLGALSAMMTSQQPKVVKTPTYCRDRATGSQYGVYRADEETAGYVLALADAGRFIRVGEALSIDGRKRFSVTYHELDRTMVYDNFNALPAPQQAFELVSIGRALSSTEVGTSTISVDSGKLR